MNPQEEKHHKLNQACFTDFNGKFQSRLGHGIQRKFAATEESKFVGISVQYEDRIQVEYQKDPIGLLARA